MPLLIVYPANLPSPSAAPYMAAERRLLTAGPMDARAAQRDGLATQDMVFPPMNVAQIAIFESWWDLTLDRGGAWFSSRWPMPSGATNGVRRFIGAPTIDFIPGGYWRVTARFQVRGGGLQPALYGETVIGLRFQGSPQNEAGPDVLSYVTQGPTIAATYPAGAAKFGSVGYRGEGYIAQPLISGNMGNFALARFGEWQITGWFKPAFQLGVGAGGYVIYLMAGRLQGDNFDAGGTTPTSQIQMRISSYDAGGCDLAFYYPSAQDNQGVCYEQNLRVYSGALLPQDGEYHFVAICGDAGGVRAYLDDALWMVDYDSTSPIDDTNRPGRWPMFVRDYDNQRFVIGTAYTGTFSDHPLTAIWPQEFSFSSGFNGDIGELWISQGLGCVEYYGTTITPPALPAILRS